MDGTATAHEIRQPTTTAFAVNLHRILIEEAGCRDVTRSVSEGER
jgi:hypothetical protein